MDKKEDIKEEELERIVKLMEDGKQLSDEELASVMQDEEVMRTCRELQNCKNAVIRQCDNDVPDVEKEWQTFRQKERSIPFSTTQPRSLANPAAPLQASNGNKSHRFLWGTLTGIAASFLIVFLYSWLIGTPSSKSGIVAFQAIDSVQQVTLQTSAGDRFALARDTREEALEAVGTLFNNKDTLELAYTARNNPDVSEENIETHRLSTPRGQDFKITLEDGTVVWMNAESSLEYPSQFGGKTRSVRLKGEAYFKVAKNAECPFVICTDRMQIQVLGTELNVRNYVSRDSHVTLINGRVQVSDSENKENSVFLNPGEDAQWCENEAFVVKNVDTDAYVYWKDGYFYFDNMPLMDVTQELGRWYNINVIFENKALMDMHIRYFCVRSETLERAISLLNRMKKIHATLSGNTLYIR